MIQRFADDVARIAAEIVDDLLDTGPCDFVEHVRPGAVDHHLPADGHSG
jgi:hypothetical protein